MTWGFGEPILKLEWRFSKPEPSDRVFCHVPEGSLFFDITQRGKVFVPMIACKPGDFGILPREWIGREFASVDDAKQQIESWYESTRKECG